MARQLLADLKAWVWFVEIERSDGLKYRLTENPVALSANGKLWAPTALKIEVPAENADGSIAEMSVTLPNVARVAVAELEARRIQGRMMTVWAQNERDFTTFVGALSWRARVLRATATDLAVQITAGHPATLQRLPRRVFDARVAPIFATRSGGAV